MGFSTMRQGAMHDYLISRGYLCKKTDDVKPPVYESTRISGPGTLQISHCTWNEGKDWYEVSAWAKDDNLDMVAASIWNVTEDDLMAHLDEYESRIQRMLQAGLETARTRA